MARKDALEKLHEVLLKRRDALRAALAGDLSMLKELHEQSKGDVIDIALDSAQDEISSQLAEVESRELAYIDVALKRMKEGTYGKCKGCSSNIPLARMQALPYATLCIECQRKAETSSDGTDPASDWSRLINAAPVDDIRISDIDINVT